jgi:hypothetical protein
MANWQNVERQIAKRLGGRRVPVSGTPALLVACQPTAFVSAEAPEGVASWLTQHQTRYTIWHSVQNGGSSMDDRVYEVYEDDKVHENRLRRKAARLGLALRKSRARRLHLNNRGMYRIVDPYRNFIIAGERFDLSLEEVEAILDDYERELYEETRPVRVE